MTTDEAIEIRDRAIALGLETCCTECLDSIERLRKLGQTSDFSLPQNHNKKVPTVGLGQEEAVRYLRRQIGAPHVVA